MTRSAWTRCRAEFEISPAGVALFVAPFHVMALRIAPPRLNRPASITGGSFSSLRLFFIHVHRGKPGLCRSGDLSSSHDVEGRFQPPRSPARQHAASPRHGATNSATPAHPSGIHHGRFILLPPAPLPPCPEGKSGACAC
jgi:hypothetical protein